MLERVVGKARRANVVTGSKCTSHCWEYIHESQTVFLPQKRRGVAGTVKAGLSTESYWELEVHDVMLPSHGMSSFRAELVLS